MKHWQIVAQVTRNTKDGAVTTQIPTFFLFSNIQGILNEDHAKRVARTIINPMSIPAVVIDMTVHEFNTGPIRMKK